MKISHHTLQIRTSGAPEFIDITDQVSATVAAAEITNGSVAFTSQHTRAAIRINENEHGFQEDWKELIAKFAPSNAYYRHNDGSIRTENIDCDDDRCTKNGHSHCQHMLLGTSETLPVMAGKLKLGRWQRIFLVELCSPRTREVILTIIGE